MSNLLDTVTQNRNIADIRSALREIGVDVSTMDDLSDVADVIRKQCVTGPNAVVNAKLASGPGIKISPLDRKGYKISANSDACIVGDLADDLPAGTSVQKVLFNIINKYIPQIAREAAATPSILGVELLKAPYDGVDYYSHPMHNKEGRKSGLHPEEWYIKIYLASQGEPLYVPMGAFVADLKRDILAETHHMVDGMIREAIRRHLHDAPHPVDPLAPGPLPRPVGPGPARPGRPHPQRPGIPFHPDGPWDANECPECHHPDGPRPPKPDRPCPPKPDGPRPPKPDGPHPMDDRYINGAFDALRDDIKDSGVPKDNMKEIPDNVVNAIYNEASAKEELKDSWDSLRKLLDECNG